MTSLSTAREEKETVALMFALSKEQNIAHEGWLRTLTQIFEVSLAMGASTPERATPSVSGAISMPAMLEVD